MPPKRLFATSSFSHNDSIAYNAAEVQETKAWKEEYTKLYRKKEKEPEDVKRLNSLQGLLMARFAFDPITESTGICCTGGSRESGSANPGDKMDVYSQDPVLLGYALPWHSQPASVFTLGTLADPPRRLNLSSFCPTPLEYNLGELGAILDWIA
jgi:hypothetical protein